MSKNNIIQFKTFKQVADKPSEPLFWQCECGSAEFWLEQNGNVQCTECNELVQLEVVFQDEEDE